MKFSASDITAMLTAAGEAIEIDGCVTVGKFKKSGKLVTSYDGSVITTGPLLILSDDDATLVTENETIIDIAGDLYQATQKMADGSGMTELELTKDYDV